MGWWSTDILGGDTPLDYKDQFFDICEVSEFPGDGVKVELTKEDFEKNLTPILQFLNEDKWGEAYIGFQVLAVLMMRAGAEISMPVKVRMLEAISSDEWAQDNDDRAIAVDGLYKALTAYDGKTPIIIRSRGLFDIMFETSKEEDAPNA